MKIFLVLSMIIMASLSFKLNAFDVNNALGKDAALSNPLRANDLKELTALIKRAKDAEKTGTNHGKYLLEREARLNDEGPCLHCPRFLSLTSEVNKIVEKMARNPGASSSEELPVKINKLKFLYYTQKDRTEDGGVECRRFLDITPDLKPTKFDGQFKLMAEDVLRFNAVSDIQYMNPKTEETVYYYRGEGADKDVVIQAVLTKDGGVLRYYRYYSTEAEKNPYNLPDFDKRYADETPEVRTLARDFMATGKEKDTEIKAAPLSEEEDNGLVPKLGTYDVKFKAEVEKRNKYIPKNVHFVEASADQDLLGDLKVKASTDLSLKGNDARVALKRGGEDLMLVELQTKITGKTEHKVIVPFSVRVMDELPAIKGRAETNSGGQVLNLSLTDKGIDYVRSEFRRNGSTGATSYVLARDIALSKSEAMSVQYGEGEDKNKFVAMRHAKSIKDNITLVLDVRVDENRRTSLLYQVQAKW